MTRLRQIIENNDTPAGRFFDFFIQGPIVLSLVSFSIETLPNLSAEMQQWLQWIEIGTVSIFTIEYLLRILVVA